MKYIKVLGNCIVESKYIVHILWKFQNYNVGVGERMKILILGNPISALGETIRQNVNKYSFSLI